MILVTAGVFVFLSGASIVGAIVCIVNPSEKIVIGSVFEIGGVVAFLLGLILFFVFEYICVSILEFGKLLLKKEK